MTGSTSNSPESWSESLNAGFRAFSRRSSQALGSAGAFVVAILVVIVWAATGPLFNYSNGWQLVINTGTTIVTFLMVFLIQNSQNRDAQATQLKLAELIRAVAKARDRLVDVEDLSDEELARLHAEFQRLGKRACVSDDETNARESTSGGRAASADLPIH